MVEVLALAQPKGRTHRQEVMAWFDAREAHYPGQVMADFEGLGGRKVGCTAAKDSEAANYWTQIAQMESGLVITPPDWKALRHARGWKEYIKGQKATVEAEASPAAPTAPLVERMVAQAAEPIRVRQRGMVAVIELGGRAVITIDLAALRTAQLTMALSEA